MAKSFQVDLGDGRRLTWPGRIVVLLAGLTVFGSASAYLYGLWRPRRLDPFLSLVCAAGAGLIVQAIGRVILHLSGIPFSRPPAEKGRPAGRSRPVVTSCDEASCDRDESAPDEDSYDD